MKCHIFDTSGNLSFKGHGMLAPFTPGWQIADVNPLVIEKSEVYLLVTFLHYITWKYHKDLGFLNPLISFLNVGLFIMAAGYLSLRH